MYGCMVQVYNEEERQQVHLIQRSSVSAVHSLELLLLSKPFTYFAFRLSSTSLRDRSLTVFTVLGVV